MKKVFISIGHGGKDTGAVGYVVEKNANLCVGLSCNSYLSKRGVKTQLSREKDENDPGVDILSIVYDYGINDVFSEDVMNEFNLGSMSIFSLGSVLSETLAEYGVREKADLIIYLNDDEFSKVDEDLFYRNRKDEKEEFVPSEGEIDITFEGVNMKIKNKSGE